MRLFRAPNLSGFNSILVRLKVNTVSSEFLYALGFNSILVRLKEKRISEFESLWGTRFNSILVRLKVRMSLNHAVVR